MIDPDTCKVIYKLHEEGMSIRQISRSTQFQSLTCLKIANNRRVRSTTSSALIHNARR